MTGLHVRIGRHPDRSGLAQGQVAKPALPELVRSWKMVVPEDRDAAGMVVYLWQDPGGLLIYDSTGHMAMQLMKTPTS